MNVSAEDLPADTQTPATSLSVEAGRPIDRAGMLVALLDALEQRYDAWTIGLGSRS